MSWLYVIIILLFAEARPFLRYQRDRTSSCVAVLGHGSLQVYISDMSELTFIAFIHARTFLRFLSFWFSSHQLFLFILLDVNNLNRSCPRPTTPCSAARLRPREATLHLAFKNQRISTSFSFLHAPPPRHTHLALHNSQTLGTLPETSTTLAICTMFKNEAPYLDEWLEYHRLLGVSKVTNCQR